MALRVCVLGSSSAGNCTYVASESTALLVDAGLSFREIGRRLEAIGADVAAVRAVCVTHEHEDHVASLPAVHRKTGAAVYANSGTIGGMGGNERLRGLPWRVFTTGAEFPVGDLTVLPFSVPHDAYDPVGFLVRCGDAAAAVVTDMGMATALIRERLRQCQVVVVESNHNVGLLHNAARPWSLKQRIAGRQGHLSNEQAARLLVEVGSPRLESVFLAHLSADCNRPDLAVSEVSRALHEGGWPHVRVLLTYPDRPSDVACAGAVRTEGTP
jgi:phosphoribosyl 1,2-cyclic phosphodiesterase